MNNDKRKMGGRAVEREKGEEAKKGGRKEGQDMEGREGEREGLEGREREEGGEVHMHLYHKFDTGC